MLFVNDELDDHLEDDFAFDDDVGEPIEEEDAREPRNPYDPQMSVIMELDEEH